MHFGAQKARHKMITDDQRLGTWATDCETCARGLLHPTCLRRVGVEEQKCAPWNDYAVVRREAHRQERARKWLSTEVRDSCHKLRQLRETL